MPVPRQRLSQRRGRTRAAHHGLKSIMTVVCPNCKKPALPHKACSACGYYKGRNMNESSAKPVARKSKPVAKAAATVAKTEPTKDSKAAK